jgi:hypothetical protein
MIVEVSSADIGVICLIAEWRHDTSSADALAL